MTFDLESLKQSHETVLIPEEPRQGFEARDVGAPQIINDKLLAKDKYALSVVTVL